MTLLVVMAMDVEVEMVVEEEKGEKFNASFIQRLVIYGFSVLYIEKLAWW